jgi:hypothetical protein
VLLVAVRTFLNPSIAHIKIKLGWLAAPQISVRHTCLKLTT